MPAEVMFLIATGLVAAVLITALIVFGVSHVTRMKIKNGYPLESMWGKPLHPHITNEAQERVSLLTQENAQLRAELGSLKDRLGNVERIVTDSGYRLTHEIESLRDKQGAN